METLSFTFGMLTVIGVASVAVIVVGLVKVFKMQNKIENTFVRIDPEWRGCDFKYKGWVK